MRINSPLKKNTYIQKRERSQPLNLNESRKNSDLESKNTNSDTKSYKKEDHDCDKKKLKSTDIININEFVSLVKPLVKILTNRLK